MCVHCVISYECSNNFFNPNQEHHPNTWVWVPGTSTEFLNNSSHTTKVKVHNIENSAGTYKFFDESWMEIYSKINFVYVA